MKSSDRRILLIVGGVIALGALWFGLISPKRSELSQLNEQVATKQAEVSTQEQTAVDAQAAKDSYESDYRELITLGKAVPDDDDASSLIDQLEGIAQKTGVEFLGLQLSEGGGSAAAADAAQTAPPPALAAPGDASGGEPAAGGESAASGDAAAPAPTTAAPATETAAADLPLGATVGAAGLPVMPYDLTMRGTYFEVADFLAAIDDMVRTDPSGVGVDGRLLTVDSIDLHPDEADTGTDELAVSLKVTAYVAPADQGATGGATPTTPAPGAATPAAVPPAATTPTPTAAVTP